MIEEAKELIAASSPQSAVYIGCDSIRYRKNNQWFAKYSTVIIVHMDSKHGCRLFHESYDLPDYGNLKQRLLTEVQHAVATATEIIDAVCRNSGNILRCFLTYLDTGDWCTGYLSISCFFFRTREKENRKK